MVRNDLLIPHPILTITERKSKDHLRSINALSVSHIVHHYCITGSADGDLRVWDLRDMSRSLMRIHHPTSVRSVVFSPSTWHPLHAVVGLDNGSIYRWDLKNGQRGLLDRLPVAHTASVTTLDWCNRSAPSSNPTETTGNGLGWLVSGGLDRCVKVWDLTGPGANARMPSKPSYTLHPSFPVRRVAWRPSYECELGVVSNVEFSSGSNPDLSQNNSVAAGGTGVSTEGDRHGADSRNAIGGDAVEIWDVRRGWIPKWSVTGSAGESGVTDLVFGDSDAIWTQNSSGTFSQIDLRHCTKPVDAITRTAATWEASGSLTFVTDVQTEWQIPYDDIHPDRRFLAEKQHLKMKALGDERFSPISQDLGTFSGETASDLEVFNRLARGYIFIGEDRPTICAVNARPLPNSTHVSAGTPTSYTFPASVSNPTQLRKTSPSHLATRSASASTSRKMTPASSNASSPRQNANALPSMTPRRPSVFSTRDNGDSDLSRRSSISMYRRPSIAAQGSLSPADKSGSLRHVGEGALDDSDSSSASESDGGDEAMQGGYSDEEDNAQALVSPGLLSARGIAAPSPLSRVAGQQRWTEDEAEERRELDDDNGDDDDSESSPSPRSTDSESSGPSRSIVRRKNSLRSASRPLKRRAEHFKSRSRSSTVASLAAAPPASPRCVVRQDSHSSIRTITAGETSFAGQEAEAGVKPDDTVRDAVGATHERHRSMPISDLTLDPPTARGENQDPGEEEQSEVDSAELTDRRIEMITADEKRFREIAWAALRDALERFADEGDIQMCAMLSVVAPNELKISKRRAGRFLESYIVGDDDIYLMWAMPKTNRIPGWLIHSGSDGAGRVLVLHVM
ncbi:hypothetical protein DXG03_008363 [Asterophora parasitica]|uniref:WD40 repeat-like protein n=1 Tax=Asterophora parasitica TaxID=117018 RepID=A0A9P7G954_9AGAR|nr:hypothetical protein DXG03_008363 [Asterophora parasitica]